jgi:hypothetical protein
MLLISFMFSCSDACDVIDCGVNGTCDDGVCLCAEGYAGFACETLVIEKYTGTWESRLCLQWRPGASCFYFRTRREHNGFTIL